VVVVVEEVVVGAARTGLVAWVARRGVVAQADSPTASRRPRPALVARRAAGVGRIERFDLVTIQLPENALVSPLLAG
jgi:hypothetical protein